MSKPKVSVIQIVFPGTDIEQFRRSHESVLNQQFANFEYIIIGEADEDKLLNISTNKNVKFINSSTVEDLDPADGVKEQHSSSKVSRSVKKNYGARVAQGKYIYFIDDDYMLSESTLLQEAYDKAESGYSMIAVHNTADASMGIWPKVRNFDKDFYKYDTGNISCRFTTRELFLGVGGFNTQLIAAEDYDVHNRMLQNEGKIGFIDAEELNLGEPTSFWKMMQKHYYYGKTMVEFKTSGGVLTFDNASPVRSGYLKQWKRFVKNPGMTMLFVIYQVSRYIAGGLGGWRIIPWLVRTTVFGSEK